MRKCTRLSVAAGALGALALVTFVEHVPDAVSLGGEPFVHDRIVVTGRAPELIPLHHVTGKGLWASRGYELYFLAEGARALVHRAHLSVELGLAWLGNSRILRHLVNEHELVELRELRDGTVLAFAGGVIHRSVDGGRHFHVVARLQHYGLGHGRGVMPQAIAEDRTGSVYWGEYWRNRRREPVRLWRSTDGGEHWSVALEFGTRQAAHVHAVQQDPYTGVVWVTTGDGDRESRIGFIDGEGGYTVVGSGSQQWRAVSLLFTEDAVIWGMDGSLASDPPISVWRWDRHTASTSPAGTLDDYAFYTAGDGERLWLGTAAELTGQAKLMLGASRDAGVSWRTMARWTRVRANGQGVLRLVAGSDGELFVGVVNLAPFRNSLLRVDGEGSALQGVLSSNDLEDRLAR